VAEDGALEARLTFPELCFDGACCELSNPTRLRGLPDQFLYDGACTADGADEFDARIFFGGGPDATSIVIVLRDRAATLSDLPARAAAGGCVIPRVRPTPLTFALPVIHPAQLPKDAWPMNLFRRYPHRRDRRPGRDDSATAPCRRGLSRKCHGRAAA
jgi:hypothetical protein